MQATLTHSMDLPLSVPQTEQTGRQYRVWSVALTPETGAYEVQVPVYQVTVNEDADGVTKTPYKYRFR